MALIDHIDGENRRIYLSSETKNTSIHPIDIYKEMRTLRRENEDLRKYDVFMKAYGNVYKGSGKYTERYVVLQNGCKIVPYNEDHFLTITGTFITDDGGEGIACFDRSLLDDDVTVDINYIPPQVEIVYINTGGSGLSQEEHDKLMSLPESFTLDENTSKMIETIYNLETGNWEIKDNQMIFYKLDGTELMRFNLYDKDNRPTMSKAYKRIRIDN